MSHIAAPFGSSPGIEIRIKRLPQATMAQNDEVFAFVERNSLYGIGIGYVDAHLLASVLLTRGSRLWTRDRRMFAAALELRLNADGLPAIP